MLKTFDIINIKEYLANKGPEPVAIVQRNATHTWLVPSAPLQDPSGEYPNTPNLWRRITFGSFVRIPAFPYVVPGTDSCRAFYYFGGICFEACEHICSEGGRINRLHMVLGGDEDLEAIYRNNVLSGFRFWAGLAVELAD